MDSSTYPSMTPPDAADLAIDAGEIVLHEYDGASVMVIPDVMLPEMASQGALADVELDRFERPDGRCVYVVFVGG